MKRACLFPLLTVLCACGPEVSARAMPQDSSSTKARFDRVPAPASRAAPDSLPAPTPSEGVPAVLFSDLDAELGARMPGVVQRVEAELGDAVQEGQVLLVLDDARERARVEAATAAAELASAQFKRLEGLGSNGFVTTAQIDSARFALRFAEAALHEAQIDLEHTRVTAPFAGVITRRTTGRGRPVRVGEALFRLTALQPLRALVRLPERDARGLRVGAAAELQTDDGVRIAARIQRVSPATDPESGTVEVLLDVPRPGPLRPGSSASARLSR
jgi:RND family efflux transporter MFP subunit